MSIINKFSQLLKIKILMNILYKIVIKNIEISDFTSNKQRFKEWFLVFKIRLVSIWSLAYIYNVYHHLLQSYYIDETPSIIINPFHYCRRHLQPWLAYYRLSSKLVTTNDYLPSLHTSSCHFLLLWTFYNYNWSSIIDDQCQS